MSASRLAIAGAIALVVSTPGKATAIQSDSMTAEQFDSSLGYQTGTISVKNGLATIRLPESYRFLGPEDSKRLLVNAWGNPASSVDDVLGMLIPAATSPVSGGGWGIVITYEEEGYVDDKDAAKIDYTALMTKMQQEVAEANAERVKKGYESLRLIGWAEPPHYDSVAHKLYWAKELNFGNDTSNTLNYNIRILGRRGVLVLNAVASMPQLPAIRSETLPLLGAIDFNEGHRYADYLPGKDKAAEYGIAGLIAGAVAAKAGFFKMLWVGLLAMKKLIVVAAAGAGAAVKRFLAARKQGPGGMA
jgi:uncharacterized membrane-anchored protein